MRRAFLLSIAGLLCAGMGRAADEALPKAETLLDRYIEVTGGKAAYAKVKSEIVHGHMDFAANGLKGDVTVYTDTSNNNYTVIDLEGVGKIEQGVYNGQAWESSAIQGTRLKEGAERADAIRDATFNGPLLWRELYDKAETTGIDESGAEPLYKVVLTPKQGKPQTVFFSKKSGLMMKRTGIVSNPMGEIPMEMTFANYKDFGGILVPTVMTNKVMGQEFSVNIDKVDVNAEIPKDRFEPPAEVKKLLAKPEPAAAK